MTLTAPVKITVHLFGHYADLFHGQPIELLAPPGSQVRDVAAQLAGRDARLANITSHCRFAVDEEYASLDTEVTDGCTIAVLPPMSGG
jgi:molybdopterin converting factor small subunit